MVSTLCLCASVVNLFAVQGMPKVLVIWALSDVNKVVCGMEVLEF